MNKVGTVFGEATMMSDEAFAFAESKASTAMIGLDNGGNSMVDPTTGQPTPFAYSGDPVARTGWLDGFDGCGSDCVEGAQVGEELRQLTSVGPFTLGAGEVTTFTAAYVYASGSGLDDGLARLRQTAATLRVQPTLWEFAPQN